MTVFVTTVILKKNIKRKRPDVPQKYQTYRIRDLRGKEIDTSLPSGDTGGATVFALYLLWVMPDLVE